MDFAECCVDLFVGEDGEGVEVASDRAREQSGIYFESVLLSESSVEVAYLAEPLLYSPVNLASRSSRYQSRRR
jgi:hypothetical protein